MVQGRRDLVAEIRQNYAGSIAVFRRASAGVQSPSAPAVQPVHIDLSFDESREHGDTLTGYWQHKLEQAGVAHEKLSVRAFDKSRLPYAIEYGTDRDDGSLLSDLHYDLEFIRAYDLQREDVTYADPLDQGYHCEGGDPFFSQESVLALFRDNAFSLYRQDRLHLLAEPDITLGNYYYAFIGDPKGALVAMMSS